MKLPFMQVSIGDFLADTIDLTMAEMGAYWLLCMAYWLNQGPLQNDEKLITRLARSQKNPEIGRAIAARFFKVDGDRLVHNRIERELEKARLAYAQHALGARTAHAKRRAQREQSQPESYRKKARDDDEHSGGASSSRAAGANGGAFKPPPADAELNLWVARCKGFARSGLWNKDQWGPQPGAPRCKAPAEAIKAAGLKIEAQGG